MGRTCRQPERRGVSRQTVIEAAKEKVPVIDLAGRLCGPDKMRKVGQRRVAKCPIRGHDERTPSFTVYLETNSWFCFGACQSGGDVVNLAVAAWGYGEGEMAMAAADLLHRFGHALPERPRSWYAKQVRQQPVRDAIAEAKVRHLQRRVFRRFVPMLEEITDPDERREEIAFLWDAAEQIAGAIWAGRRVS